MNLTLSVEDEVVERAREVARQQGTSLNALVRQYLENLAGRRTGEQLARELEGLWAERSGSSGGGRFNRDEVYAGRIR